MALPLAALMLTRVVLSVVAAVARVFVACEALVFCAGFVASRSVASASGFSFARACHVG